jgi:ferric-dicitrate binding protein FerR (iron transport regulator)
MRSVLQRAILCAGLLLAGAGTAQAQTCEKSVGRLVSLQGVVEARGAQQSAWQAARLHASFCPGDAIRTGARSRAALVLANETIVRLDQLTTLTLSGLDVLETSWVDLLIGAAHFLSRTPRALKVRTPYVNAGIEGTEFVVRADRDEGSVVVFEGRVRRTTRWAPSHSAAEAPRRAPARRRQRGSWRGRAMPCNGRCITRRCSIPARSPATPAGPGRRGVRRMRI